MDCTYNISTGSRIICTTVTCKGFKIKQWLQRVEEIYESKRTVVVGLDVEWKPNRRRTDNNPPATLQICVGHRCLIIQLLYADYLPSVLHRFLRGDKYIFAGVGIHSDAVKLQEAYNLTCGEVYDVKDAVMERWPERFSASPGLREIANEVADVWLHKPLRITLSNWENMELTYEQVHYACLDAFASCRVGVNLVFRLYH